MNFEITEEQRMLRDTFARFSDERIRPQASAIDEAKAFPRELFEELAGLDFFRLRYPETAGGLGLDFLSYCLAITEIAMDRITSADRRIRAVDEQLPRSQPHRLRPFVELARMAVQAGIGDWGAAEDTLEELARMTPLPADPDALALLEKTGDLAAAATETPLALDAYDEARALAEALKDSEAVDRVTRKLATLG